MTAEIDALSRAGCRQYDPVFGPHSEKKDVFHSSNPQYALPSEIESANPMPLAPGLRLGPYEILAPIGAGGMGEVYKARDTRLNRIVAVKILPEHLSPKPELWERFKREARSISSLNHPNICTLFDVGNQEGTDYLVMEYVEGPTLAGAITHSPIPLDESLGLAKQIAEALNTPTRRASSIAI